MTVSRLLGYSLLIILLGVVIGLSPVSAGEHPWDGNNVNKPNDSTAIGNGGAGDDPQTPTDPSDQGNEPLYGVPLIMWWQLSIQYSATGNIANAEATKIGTSQNIHRRSKRPAISGQPGN